ncbi:VOC family protein [archaeon]|nr:MAG: VOC family protein [archaeon]
MFTASMAVPAVCTRILLFARDPAASRAFWSGALRLPLITTPPPSLAYAAGTPDAPLTIHVHSAEDSEARCAVGYGPMLCFTVTDLDSMVPAALAAGGHLDGGIQYNEAVKLAVLRSPDGAMVTLTEYQLSAPLR